MFLSRIFHLRFFVGSKNFGNFASIFKGNGIQFTQTKKYEAGDSSRHINRRASSRQESSQGSLRSNVFSEEKEAHIDLFLDINYNRKNSRKNIQQRGQQFIQEAKKHGVSITLFLNISGELEQQERKKNYQAGIQFFTSLEKKQKQLLPVYTSSYEAFLSQALRTTKKRSIVLISDFLTENQETKQQLQQLQKNNTIYLLPIEINAIEGQNY